MGPDNSLADAAMGGDVVAGTENREPRRLQIRHAFKQLRRERRLPGIFFQLVAEAEQDEGAPVGAFGTGEEWKMP